MRRSFPSAARVKARRDRLCAYARRIGYPATTQRHLTEIWLPLFPRAHYHALYQSVGWLADVLHDGLSANPTPQSDRRLSELAAALAAHPAPLRMGEPVFPYSWPSSETPVLAEIVSSRAEPARTGTRAVARLRVLAGPGAPGTFPQSWSAAALRYWAHHPRFGLGFSRSGPQPRPFVHPGQLTGLLLYALLTTQGGFPRARKTWATEALRRVNVELTDKRLRRDRAGFPCPRSYTHPCHFCPESLARCPVATHPDDWIVVSCSRCRTRQYADPSSGGVCIRCCARSREIN